MQVTAENVVGRTHVFTEVARVLFGAVNFPCACVAEKKETEMATAHYAEHPPFNVLIETLPHACFLCAVFFLF